MSGFIQTLRPLVTLNILVSFLTAMPCAAAWIPTKQTPVAKSSILSGTTARTAHWDKVFFPEFLPSRASDDDDDDDDDDGRVPTARDENRRNFLQRTITGAAACATPAALLLGGFPDSVGATVNPTEAKCDPGDVRCRQDGKLGDVPSGKPIPPVTNRITYVVQITIDVGERGEEAGFIRVGLYGDDCPKSVQQLLLFLTKGITSMSQDTLENGMGLEYAPVSLLDNGIVPDIFPGTAVAFGVPSQSKSYAKSRGMTKAGSKFVPQSRPPVSMLQDEENVFPRPHDAAGLVSIPAQGIGYANPKEPEDEAYSSAFTITANEAPLWDDDKQQRRRRRVIGQVIDNESMQFLDRLANLPVLKGKTNSGMPPPAPSAASPAGPPLLKVRVRDVDVQKVNDVAAKKRKR